MHGYSVELCENHVEKQICKRANFISSVAPVILPSIFLWSFLLWIFFFHLYSEISPEWFRSFQLPVWRYLSLPLSLHLLNKKTVTFLGTSSLSCSGSQKLEQHIHSLPNTLCHFSSLYFLGSRYWIYNSHWHWGPFMMTVMICHAGYVWIIFF